MILKGEQKGRFLGFPVVVGRVGGAVIDDLWTRDTGTTVPSPPRRRCVRSPPTASALAAGHEGQAALGEQRRGRGAEGAAEPGRHSLVCSCPCFERGASWVFGANDGMLSGL